MQRFKRNQIEQAISRTMEGKPSPRSELRTRLKRLLDLDRTQERASIKAARYAFYSYEKPGKGMESYFSEYEAFALMMGIRFLDHGWPQAFVISTLREARRELEERHADIILKKPKRLLARESRQPAQAGDLAFTNADPAFLLIVSDQMTDNNTHDGPYPRVFLDRREAMKFQLQEAGRSCSWFELVTAAWNLRENLGRSLPRLRGRNG